jgi:2-dehydro-3-deoxygluconokinase
VLYYRSGSAASRLSPDDLRPEVFAGAHLLHITGITPALSPTCAATVAHAIELAHAHGVPVSFDPNYRAALWESAVAREALLPLMKKADILLIGHEDGRAILGVDDEESILQHGIELGARIVVCKLAERGACAWDGSTRILVPAENVAAAVDPVGAGDAFGAGFLASWLRGSTLEEALRMGVRSGAVTVAVTGDYISREQFAQFFAEQ